MTTTLYPLPPPHTCRLLPPHSHPFYCVTHIQSPIPKAGVDPNWITEIPGKLGDRKTPLGKLNWIFTALTDTIAWNSLPSDLFQRLFRQDLLVASLFRNFLLADRILRGLGCSPVSVPRLPPMSEHLLWQTWDSAAALQNLILVIFDHHI